MSIQDRSKAIERLTALWALSEAGLGGFLHAVKAPFTGTLIGLVSVLIVCLIAHFADKKLVTIFRAVTIVLIVKMTVSPYTPLTACFAVSFQATMGAMLFHTISNFRVAAFILGIVSLVECAGQRILFLTVLYGNSLWDSVNIFFNYLGQQVGISPSGSDLTPSFWLISIYLGIYAAVGAGAGFLGGLLPNTATNAMKSAQPIPLLPEREENTVSGHRKPRRLVSSRKLMKYGLWVFVIVAVLSFLGPAMGGAARGAYVIIRTILVLMLWYFLIAPILIKLIRGKLKSKEKGYISEIRKILDLFPHLKAHARYLWNQSDRKKGITWGWYFLVSMVVFALSFDSEPDPALVSSNADAGIPKEPGP